MRGLFINKGKITAADVRANDICFVTGMTEWLIIGGETERRVEIDFRQTACVRLDITRPRSDEK